MENSVNALLTPASETVIVRLFLILPVDRAETASPGAVPKGNYPKQCASSGSLDTLPCVLLQCTARVLYAIVL